MSTDTASTDLPAIKLSSLKADLDKEREGEFIDIPEWPGVSLGVRSIETPAYTIARDFLLRRLARKFKDKPIPPDVRSKEFGKLYAEHLLFGWKGLDTEYTKAGAMEALSDPAYRKLVSAVEWASGQVGETDVEYVKEAEKN